MTKEAIIPNEVTFYLTESDNFIFDYGALNEWTPFQAACVISGYRPGRVVSGHARVGIPIESYTETEIGEFDPCCQTRTRELLKLAAIIARNAGGNQVSASDTVNWSIGKNVLSAKSQLARYVIGSATEEEQDSPSEAPPKADGRGKHHEEKRIAILGFVIAELARNIDSEKIPGLVKKDKISAQVLTDYMHQYRNGIDLPDDESIGFKHDSILDVLRKSFSAAQKYSRSKNSVSTD